MFEHIAINFKPKRDRNRKKNTWILNGSMEKMPCLETTGLFKESIGGDMTASEKKEHNTLF